VLGRLHYALLSTLSLGFIKGWRLRGHAGLSGPPDAPTSQRPHGPNNGLLAPLTAPAARRPVAASPREAVSLQGSIARVAVWIGIAAAPAQPPYPRPDVGAQHVGIWAYPSGSRIVFQTYNTYLGDFSQNEEIWSNREGLCVHSVRYLGRTPASD
jgi:hypothetical protein